MTWARKRKHSTTSIRHYHCIALLAIAWSINFFNFMDGIDGIAGSQAVFVATGVAVLGFTAGQGSVQSIGVLIAGASLGFLVWNWAPARIFMGDAGSGFLGFALAAASVLCLTAGRSATWVVLILPAVFLADATVTLIRRASRRERLHHAHRSHAYQHLSRQWGSHARVTTLYIALDVAFLAPLGWFVWTAPQYGAVVVAAVYLLLSMLAFRSGAGRP